MQYRTRMWTIAIEAPRIISATNCIHNYSRSAHLFPDDRPLRMLLRMAALYCGRTPCTNRFWEHETLFSAWGFFQPPQPSRLDTSNLKTYLALASQVSLIQLVSSDPLSWAQVCFLTGRLFIDVMYLKNFCQGWLESVQIRDRSCGLSAMAMEMVRNWWNAK